MSYSVEGEVWEHKGNGKRYRIGKVSKDGAGMEVLDFFTKTFVANVGVGFFYRESRHWKKLTMENV